MAIRNTLEVITVQHRDQGMTLIEVVVAITIFLIGVGFIAQSNSVAMHFNARQEIRQQMIFYAAGQLEAAIEKEEGLTEPEPPFNNFATTIIKRPTDEEMKAGSTLNGLPLQEIEVSVSLMKNGVADPNIPAVKLKTYRAWTPTP
ncbi:type IV pilus modification PilV family protein [Desulfitobacterium sp.]|uniref:type IV pilus modification PilV family protein n=1 Tax=Desulfitobacterium sp. TaxID=49981 RepID=UPI002B20FC22|nr:prepilin-type N-terminal cleavage/methylation domain-containing protein [Desulfitobacterium sp.]MEA4900445.1 prepilin-type N-terminal cleavage/methylation domain-containing protein [Desulfitobacterium sp.]